MLSDVGCFLPSVAATSVSARKIYDAFPAHRTRGYPRPQLHALREHSLPHLSLLDRDALATFSPSFLPAAGKS